MPLPTQDATRGCRRPRGEIVAISWRRLLVAQIGGLDAVLAEEPLEALPVDSRLGRRAIEIASAALEHAHQVLALHRRDPSLARILDRQILADVDRRRRRLVVGER